MGTRSRDVLHQMALLPIPHLPEGAARQEVPGQEEAGRLKLSLPCQLTKHLQFPDPKRSISDSWVLV